MIRYSYLLFIFAIFVYFKSILLLLLPNIFINAIIFLALFTLIFSLTYNNQIRLTSMNLLILTNMFFLSLLIPYSLIIQEIHLKLVFYAYLRILFVLLVFLIAWNIKAKTLYLFMLKLKKIIFIYIVFGMVEVFIPVSIKTSIISWFVLSKSGMEETSLNMYYFKEFGMETMRLGSVAFEPITFGMISALGIYILLKEKSSKAKLFLYLIVNFLTFAKSGIVTTIMLYLSKLFKKYFLPLIILFITMLFIIFVYLFGSIVIELIQSDKSYEYIRVFIVNFATVGNHIIGLVMGLVSAVEAPLLGHGLGTAGFVISNEAIKLGLEGPTILNGNESTIGTLAYQIGYTGLVLLLMIFYKFFDLFRKMKDFISLGIIVGFFIFMLLSESSFAMAIITLFIFSIAYVYRIKNVGELV